MKDYMKEWEGTPFPEMIRNLPEVDMPYKGIKAWVFQSKEQQIVFFDIEPIGEVPPHSHSSQWGMVIEGKMSLTIGGETRLYEKGDWYWIPAGVVHSATFPERVFVMDIFDEPKRYKPKAK